MLLASTFFRKRVLAPATEKSDGETGVLLAVGSGELKIFDKERESYCFAGGVCWQKGSQKGKKASLMKGLNP